MNLIRNIFFIVAIALLTSACHKDDEVTPIKPPTENPDNGGGEETTVPPTTADLMIYFKISDKQTVAQAAQLVMETTGKQTVNGKVINVFQSNISARNEQDGKFTVTVKGTISDKAFSKEYAFEGFLRKPSDYYMALRAQVRWKAQFAESPEASQIAFDEFYRLKQIDKFTPEYLSQWVEFYSSIPEGGNLYIFSNEDLANTQILEIKYDDDRISFIISYKGTKGESSSKGRPSLNFDKNKYYKRKVAINTEKTKQFYMQGVYENLDLFYADAITIDNKEVFIAQLVPDSKIADSENNTIHCQLSLVTHENTNDVLAQFEFKYEGFKPLSDLKQEWLLATSAELDEYMSKRVRNAADGDVLEIINKYPISYWILSAQMSVIRNDGSAKLFPIKMTQGNVDIDAWRGGKGNLDILLLAPRFEVKSAQKKVNRLKLQVSMIYVNDVELIDVVAPLEVIL